MSISLLALIVLGAFGLYVMSPEERARLRRSLVDARRRLAGRMRWATAAGRWLRQGLREKNPWALAVAGGAAALVLAVAAQAIYLRSLTDVRPEIARVLAVEERTASAYQRAVDQFKLGTVTALQLVGVIETAVMPELTSAATRIGALERVPARHRLLIAKAQDYLTLREKSWRLRADALRKHSLVALRTADSAEHVSLEALQDVKRMDAALASD